MLSLLYVLFNNSNNTLFAAKWARNKRIIWCHGETRIHSACARTKIADREPAVVDNQSCTFAPCGHNKTLIINFINETLRVCAARAQMCILCAIIYIGCVLALVITCCQAINNRTWNNTLLNWVSSDPIQILKARLYLDLCQHSLEKSALEKLTPMYF